MYYKFLKSFCPVFLFTLSFLISSFAVNADHMPVDSVGVEKKGSKIFVLYKVDAGETLSSISRKYNTSVEAIRAENNLGSDGLKPGDVIKVPYTAKPSYAGKKVHTVEASQTLYSIARQYNVTLEDIKKWNNLSSNEISLGQQLIVGDNTSTAAATQAEGKRDAQLEQPVKQTVSMEPVTPATNAAGQKVHTVEASQGLFAIARMYNLPIENLRKWNNLSSDNLKVGQEILLEEPEQIAQASRQETVEAVKEPEKPKEKEQNRRERKRQQENAAKANTEPVAVQTDNSQPAEPVAQAAIKSSEKDAVKKEEKQENYTIANTSGYVKKVEAGLAEVIESGSNDMFLALHRTAPVGTIMQVRNQMNDLSVFVKVIGKLPDTGANDKVIVKLSKKAYERLAALDKRFRVELSYMP